MKRGINNITKLIFASLLLLFVACDSGNDYDASGSFEADELIVVAEANGKILELNINEGDQLTKNQQVGIIDPEGANLQKEQVLARLKAIGEKTQSASPQVEILQTQMTSQEGNIAVLQEQLKTAEREQERTANLLKSDAATQQQMDNANDRVTVLQKQIQVAQDQLKSIAQQVTSTQESVAIQNRAVLSEKAPTETQVAQMDYLLQHHRIQSPINGTVLVKYAYQGEYATQGKPIFKIADLSEMTLRAYVTGDQLSQIKLGQKVTVKVDDGKAEMRKLDGVVDWISDAAEFTPKTIQTKNERANLVYATKIRVKNDGYLKIGMYGEVVFNLEK